MDITELIELIKQAAIDIINQTQPQSQPFFSGGDLIAIVVALLATVASVYGIISTNRMNKKINQDIIDANEKLNEANIDANLTAHARIEWIQNVRSVTTDLIASCYSFLDIMSGYEIVNGKTLVERNRRIEEIEKVKDERRIIANEKKLLFTLYFGPDEDGSFTDKIEKKGFLHDKTSNKGKNELLVFFVNSLFNDELGMCDLKHSSIMRGGSQDVLLIDQDIKKHKQDNAYTKLSELSEIMRIYLKIEWNRAKEGK